MEQFILGLPGKGISINELNKEEALRAWCIDRECVQTQNPTKEESPLLKGTSRVLISDDEEQHFVTDDFHQ
jgi:hypothetical protein